MRFQPRLLPMLVAAATLLFGAKLADVWFAIDLGAANEAHAETTAAKPASGKDAAAPPSVPQRAVTPVDKSGQRDASLYSPQEIEILQSLAQRRQELDKRDGQFDQREAMLQAAEQRINEKIAKLQEMQAAIDASFKKEDNLDDAKLKSLVKIYETMKPKEAARIFDQLDMPILLDVMERMKERNTAPILAGMDPAKAKTVTAALAARHPTPALGKDAGAK
jgi:flagellar motility protein MotE (MotC chaperone)